MGLFSKFFKSKNRSVKPDNLENTRILEEGNTQDKSPHIYKHYFLPLRKIYLWGWDQDNNPGFLVLYGLHEFEETGSDFNELKEDVLYTDYAVFSGRNGHFPSFESVKIIEIWEGRKQVKRMHYKKDINESGYWRKADRDTALSCFDALGKRVSFPYFTEISHETYVDHLTDLGIGFKNFRLARTPNDVLALTGNMRKYEQIIGSLLSNPNIYIRKKRLRELLLSNPPQELYTILMKIGSSELISGLFLELALLQNNQLAEEARNIIQADIKWLEGGYSAGLKRCAALYTDSLDSVIKNKRIDSLRKNLPAMDLHLICVNGKEIPKEVTLEGADYAKYERKGLLSEFEVQYSHKIRRSGFYEKGPYTDGTVLNIKAVKESLQEAEVFGLADIIGKIAYYLDAPRLTFHLKANKKYKALMYFRRYVRRIIDSYAVHDEERFMEAMKALLSSYTDEDYSYGIKGNFQYNYFIKHYLYHSFNEKTPDNWALRFEWIKNDQHRRLEGNYAFRRDVWGRHIDAVIDTLSQVRVFVIVKALYYILKESVSTEYLTEELSYEKLIKLTCLSYQPAGDMFTKILDQKLSREDHFHAEIMFQLLRGSKDVRHKALEYHSRTCGRMAAKDLTHLISAPHFDEWKEIFCQSLEAFDGDEYLMFLHEFMTNLDTAATNSQTEEAVPDISEELQEILVQSLDRLTSAAWGQLVNLLSAAIGALSSRQMPENVSGFIEAIVFSRPLQELKEILKSVDIKDMKSSGGLKYSIVYSLLKGIKNDESPSDSALLEMLEAGTPGLINMLIQIMTDENKADFRFSTLLIMLESNVAPLNERAKSIFDGMSEAPRKKLHSLIIDSPDKKTYEYGLEKLYEIYEQQGSLIPKDLIIHMLEHPASEVKSYISGKLNEIVKTMGQGNKELFMYYVKTLLLLPNKISPVKNNIYETLPLFVKAHKEKQAEVEAILLDIGGSNILLDSERALVALVKIRKEVA